MWFLFSQSQSQVEETKAAGAGVFSPLYLSPLFESPVSTFDLAKLLWISVGGQIG